MKKLILASAIASAFAAQGAYAADAAPAATPEHQIAYTVTLTSDYRFRGISQTQKEAALQLAADYTHAPTGIYVGAFASNIKWIRASGMNIPSDQTAPVEIDLYGGIRGDIGSSGLTFDVGAIQYFFPGETLKAAAGTAANTSELYGQIGFGPAYAKYSYSLTDTFATGKSGSFYIDTGINHALTEKLMLNAHVGHQTYKDTGAYNYNYEDFKLGLTNDFGYFLGSVAYIGTNAIHGNYRWNGTFVSKDALVFSAAKTF